MRTLFAVLMVCGLLASFTGCCCLHDTCDCCSDICSGCTSNGGYYYTGPAGPKAEEIKKLPLPKEAAPAPKIEQD
jgi:hypothetical protein